MSSLICSEAEPVSQLIAAYYIMANNDAVYRELGADHFHPT
jgi:hypothetical protein